MICNYKFAYLGFNNEKMYKPSCRSGLLVPKLGRYCPFCGDIISVYNKPNNTKISRRKYYMYICRCGKIHMIKLDIINEADSVNKDVLLVCADCGESVLIGSDVDENHHPYKLYSYTKDFSTYSNRVITVKEFESDGDYKGIHKILFNHGIKVPMSTGDYANCYNNGTFADINYTGYWNIQRKDITVEEIIKYINKYNKDRTIVNMDRFIRENSDEILEELSHYLIKAFDWKGTKYE